jgi:hypothetical protein
MTTQYLSDHDELDAARRAKQDRLTAAPMVGALASAAADEGQWLTAILRPAGTLDKDSLRRLAESLGYLAGTTNMIIVDLTAAVVANPRAFARDLVFPARRFEQAGQCLLLLGAAPELAAALDRYAVPVVTLAADTLPPPAA